MSVRFALTTSWEQFLQMYAQYLSTRLVVTNFPQFVQELDDASSPLAYFMEFVEHAIANEPNLQKCLDDFVKTICQGSYYIVNRRYKEYRYPTPGVYEFIPMIQRFLQVGTTFPIHHIVPDVPRYDLIEDEVRENTMRALLLHLISDITQCVNWNNVDPISWAICEEDLLNDYPTRLALLRAEYDFIVYDHS